MVVKVSGSNHKEDWKHQMEAKSIKLDGEILVVWDFNGGKLTIPIKEIENLEIEHPTGIWQGEGDGYADGEIVIDTWICSECGHVIEDEEEPDFDYYPKCGAKMEKWS